MQRRAAGDGAGSADPTSKTVRVDGDPPRDSNSTAPVDWRRSTEPGRADTTPSDDRLPGPLQTRDRQRYTVLGEHGRGGLGRVLRARDRELDRVVAIKELLAPGRTSEMRFFREALITARLEHPGIVPVHEAGRWPDGTPFYAMKLVEGRSLEALIERAGGPAERLTLLPNVIAVADAIAYAHENRIVHRDLKPSNVVVGDFGETMVIDWGLAKALDDSAAAEEGPVDGPYRMPAPEGVTYPGGPLGTPAFMPPEQFIGQADERSDIFALGGILFHVLSGQPPRSSAADRLDPFHVAPLGDEVPRDLAAIAGRALARDPRDRYPSARDFADDLRRYMRRQPVRARRYSVFARAALGFVRHRALASAILVAAVIVAAVSVVGGVRSNRQRARAEQALDALAIKHAELLLKSDPTASARLLGDYRGPDGFLRDFLLAEARGLGVARLVASPHIDTVHFLAADGGEVLSLSEDQRVALTDPSGSRFLAQDVGRYGGAAADYAPATRVLVYGHSMGGVAIRHLDRDTTERRRTDLTVQAIALSPDGTRVGMVGAAGEIAVEPVAGGAGPPLAPIPGARLVRFADRDTLVVMTDDAVRSIDLAGAAGGTHPLPGARVLAVDAERTAAGTAGGQIEILASATMAPLAAAAVCKGEVVALRFIPRRPLVAFACQDGVAGAADVQTGAPAFTFSTERAVYRLAASDDGRFLAAGGQSTVVYLYDLGAQTLSRYIGHAASVSALALTADPAAPLISADLNGAIRVWDLPRSDHRVVMRASKEVFHAAFSPDSRFLVADGEDGIVRLFDRELGHLTELAGHTDLVYGIAFSPGRPEFATWGYDGTVRRWSLGDHPTGQALIGHRGMVKDGDYIDDTTLVTAGSDGRLLAWQEDGSPRELVHHPASFVSLEALRAIRSVVVSGAGGELHIVSGDGAARALPTDGVPITMLRAAADGRTFATGGADGTVRVYTADTPRVVLRAAGPIRHIAFSPGESLLAIASEDGRVHLQTLSGTATPWSQVSIRARYVAFSPSGDLLAITCGDGTVWYYAMHERRWRFTRPHQADTYTGQFSPDGRQFASSDGAGVVVLHDISQVERAMDMSQGDER